MMMVVVLVLVLLMIVPRIDEMGRYLCMSWDDHRLLPYVSDCYTAVLRRFGVLLYRVVPC